MIHLISLNTFSSSSCQTIILCDSSLTSTALILTEQQGRPIFATTQIVKDGFFCQSRAGSMSEKSACIFSLEMSCSGGSLDPQDMEARQPTSPMAKLSLFWKASLPCVLAGLGSCSKFHPVPLLPALSPIIRPVKHPSEGVAELIVLLLF